MTHGANESRHVVLSFRCTLFCTPQKTSVAKSGIYLWRLTNSELTQEGEEQPFDVFVYFAEYMCFTTYEDFSRTPGAQPKSFLRIAHTKSVSDLPSLSHNDSCKRTLSSSSSTDLDNENGAL